MSNERDARTRDATEDAVRAIARARRANARFETTRADDAR